MADRQGSPPPVFGPQVGDESRRPPVAEPATGRVVVGANVVGTAAFVMVAAASEINADWFTMPLLVVSLVGFGGGTVAFLAAFAIAVSRSRTEAIGMGGLFFLARSAPRRVQVVMMGCWALQIVVAFVVASLGVFTAAAFALLAPMWGIGLAGLWGARHGAFPPRVDVGSPVPGGKGGGASSGGSGQ